jgi:putative secretion ATPase (PEP-CTERM system associated)
MYEEFFSFSAAPFRLNPDPKFFFGSRSHNKAMAYLHYGLRQAEGFIVITGEIGAGKSILIGHLIDQLDRSNVVAAHLLTTNLEPSALLSHILSAFRIEPSSTGKSAEIEAFEDFLFDQMNRGRRVLLIVDEAQNLPIRTMEELRMLSNMDYDGTPLFQVFMVGQPEFRGILAEPHMEQFRQRIIASYHLEPLGQGETTDYIRHRLALVGWNNDPSITDEAYKAIFLATGGVPRKINKLCNRILLYCSIEKLHAIDEGVVKAVVTDLKSENLERATQARADAAPVAAEPAAAPAKAEEAKPVEEPAKREAKAANGGEPLVSADVDEKPVEKRAPVVVPFATVRKLVGAVRPGANGKVKDSAPAVKSSAKPDQKVEPAPSAASAPEAPKAESVGPAESEAKKAAVEEAMPKKKAETSAPAKSKPAEAAKKSAEPAPAKDAAPAAQKAAAPAEKPAAPPGEVAAPEKPAAPATEKPAAVEKAAAPAAAMSVLDRLRAQRSGAAPAADARAETAQETPAETAAAASDSDSEREADRSPATLNDVAKAIAAISAAGEAARKAREAEKKTSVADQPRGDLESEEPAAGPASLGEPPLAIDPKGWRVSIVKSINETREELKTAHANVARLRKQLGAIDSRRREKRQKIAANLARAESLLTEIRNAWR